ncbi:MAG: hypothetical protein IPJ34_17005 [Myxococcales bacterium]|nr:hypothetical protein [Myxococcales bacterium]
MTLTRSFLPLVAIGLLAVGCAGKDASSTLSAEGQALVEDDAEASSSESDLESGLEEPLSGAAEGGEVDLTATADTVAESGRKNPGIFFQPAGCIVSTRAANVVTHVFTSCTGPYGMTTFNGTVTSTWSKIDSGVQVAHSTKGFQINGATVDHDVTIKYTKVGGVYTRTRSGKSSGKTAKGRTIAHDADYVTVYDATSRCIKRDGSSSTTIGGAAFSRSIKGYERCGIGRLGCPKGGTFTLTRPKLSLVIQFLGGTRYDVVFNGDTYERNLICVAK